MQPEERANRGEYCDTIVGWRGYEVRLSIFSGIVLLGSMVAFAADEPFDIKPGLWEITMTTQTSGAPPIPNLDQMTPEQRARIEAVLKNSGARPITSKQCITREGIQKAIAEANSSKDKACAPRLVSSSASKLVVHIECSAEGREMKSNGDIIVERQDSEHFKATGAVKITGSGGRTMEVKPSMTGAFVSSDCGNVKPNE